MTNLNKLICKLIELVLLLAISWHSTASPLFDISLGTAFNQPGEVRISQQGFEDLTFTTPFESRGFTMPVYYSLRGGWQFDECSIELEMIHHKLYGTELPEEVQHFEISHGLNGIFSNSTCLTQRYFPNLSLLNDSLLRFGIGAALANPFTIVRGQEWFENGGITAPVLNESGYHLTGPFFQLGLQKRGPLGLSVETKWIGGWVNVPIVNGDASFWHQSIHFLIGISLR